MTLLPEELRGAADLHVHSAPDIVERRFHDLDLAREAARAGLSAILIKSHQNSTVERATIAALVVPEIRVFGGLVLNDPVGGLNPAAVRVALQLGAKQIWMPTSSAQNHRSWIEGKGARGLTIVDESGVLLPAVEDILRQIAATDCILGTGHLSPEEGTVVVRRAAALGIRRILVTHPEWRVTLYPNALQKELAAEGALFERCFVSTTHRGGFTPFETIESAIGEVGVETTVLSTDLGQPDTPSPVEGLVLYAERLRTAGFGREEIRKMAVENPRRLLGLDLNP